MRITISGLPGSGTTTVARLLSAELSMELISAGEMFRQLAADRQLHLAQFSKLAEEEDNFDRWIDDKQREEGMKRDNVIIEGRLSGLLLPNAELKVWLKAPEPVRAMRIAAREHITYEAALTAMRERERSERTRYMRYYGLDMDDLTGYDLIIDSSRWGERDIVAMIRLAKERVR